LRTALFAKCTTPAGGGDPAGVVLVVDNWEEVTADLIVRAWEEVGPAES